MKLKQIIPAVILLITLTSCNNKDDDIDIPYIDTNGTSNTKTTNYQYEKIFYQHEFESFLRGENPTLIEGCPELLYDDTILLDYFETTLFFQTENAYYLMTKQHPQKNKLYRFQQIGDYITQYIKYDLLRS